MIIVSGNRSGDLDSLVSSFTAAKLLEKTTLDKTVRVVNYFEPDDWKLHRDVSFLFRQCGFSINDFLPAGKLKDIIGNQPFEIVLTDHNSPEEELAPFKDKITAITDHHLLTGSPAPSVRLVLDNTGSCCTLVAEEFLQILADRPEVFSDREKTGMAEMLYFTIRMDTDHLVENRLYNLSRDRKVLVALKLFVGKNELFLETLKKEKENTEGFSAEDYLKRDGKFWKQAPLPYGICTITISPEEYFPLLEEFPGTIERFMKKNGIDLLFLMHFLKHPILKRELSVLSSESNSLLEDLVGSISRSGYFKERKNGEHPCFVQRDPHLSRKKIQPILDEIIKNLLETNND